MVTAGSGAPKTQSLSSTGGRLFLAGSTSGMSGSILQVAGGLLVNSTVGAAADTAVGEGMAVGSAVAVAGLKVAVGTIDPAS